jgi:hypothetical protein
MDMKKKNVSSIVLLLTTIFSGPLLFSCGTPEVTSADNLGYKTTATANPNCTCKNKATATPSPVSTPDIMAPTPYKSPDATDENYGWQSPAPGITPEPTNTAAPVVEEPKKKTLVGQWIEKIGNLFKKKKTEE